MQQAYSQLVVQPLSHDPARKKTHSQRSSKKGAELLKITSNHEDTIPLPFFDDFALSEKDPDPELWSAGGGVYINNKYGIRPLSQNVASFDGMDADGARYSDDFDDHGPCDTLTSYPISLGFAVPDDSVYLSFYWQRGGLGEPPDSNIFEIDSLVLQLKDATDAWENVWRARHLVANDTFLHELIYLPDTYLYDGFRFRIRSYGRQAGNFDVWNVDYIHLDTSRAFRTVKPDVAISHPPTNLLSRYTAMPWEQYFADKDAETADTVMITLNNLNSSFQVITDFSGSALIDTVSGTTLHAFAPGDIVFSSNPLDAFEQQGRATYLVDKDAITSTGDRMVIESFFLLQSADDDSQIPPVDFRRNDTIAAYTVLDDYYAYDDGSAEFGITFLNQPFSQAAQRFELTLPDTITHIDVHFPEIGDDATGEALALRVWKTLEGIDGATETELLTTQSIPLSHEDSINKFRRYQLLEPQVLSGTFFIGWETQTNAEISLGFDVHNDATEHIFYNMGTIWFAYPEEEKKGAIMIRPVFENGAELVTSIAEKDVQLAAHIYPNPTTGQLTIEGEATEAILTNLHGQTLLQTPLLSDKTTISLHQLPKGLYLLHLQNHRGQKTEKIVIH